MGRPKKSEATIAESAATTPETPVVEELFPSVKKESESEELARLRAENAALKAVEKTRRQLQREADAAVNADCVGLPVKCKRDSLAKTAEAIYYDLRRGMSADEFPVVRMSACGLSRAITSASELMQDLPCACARRNHFFVRVFFED